MIDSINLQKETQALTTMIEQNGGLSLKKLILTMLGNGLSDQRPNILKKEMLTPSISLLSKWKKEKHSAEIGDR